MLAYFGMDAASKKRSESQDVVRMLMKRAEVEERLRSIFKEVHHHFPSDGEAIVESAWKATKADSAGAIQVDSEGSYWLN